MNTQTAEFSCVLVGSLDVLSIGKGDLKLTIGGDNPDDVDKARKLIEEMLLKGYSIFVETDRGLSRVKRFNPKRMTYVISEIPEEADRGKTGKATAAKAAAKRRTVERNVPVAGSRATAVGRTAGG